MTHTNRLYIAVRADLPAGLQCAQAVHAAFEFSQQHPEITTQWVKQSNYTCVVSVPNEWELVSLLDGLDQSVAITVVNEPDLLNQTTAIAFEPSDEVQDLCRSLPLALRGALVGT